MKNKKMTVLAGILAASLMFSACGSQAGTSTDSDSVTASEETTVTTTDTTVTTVEEAVKAAEEELATVTETVISVKESDEWKDYTKEEYTDITLADEGSTISGEGAVADGSNITIKAGGSYVLAGTLTDGSINISVGEEEKVNLYLNGVSISCSDGAAISESAGDKVIISLVEGTENVISGAAAEEDSSEDSSEDSDTTIPDGAIYCQDSLTINGTGNLTVSNEAGHGIVCKDILKIMEGTISVTAADSGIIGKDSLYVGDADIFISCGTDGLKSDKEEEGKGYVLIEGGTVTMEAGDDGIHSESGLFITGADTSVTVTGSQEGLEGNHIVITGGTISVMAEDDGMNAAGESDQEIVITGGNMKVNAAGDGIDSNGSIYMSDGELILSGPINDGNGTIDYVNKFIMTGGILAGSGSSGMLQTISSESSQYVISYTQDTGITAGTEITLAEKSGDSLISFTVDKESRAIVISTPQLQEGTEYQLTIGSETVTVTAEAGSDMSEGPGGQMPGGKGGMQRPDMSGNGGLQQE